MFITNDVMGLQLICHPALGNITNPPLPTLPTHTMAIRGRKTTSSLLKSLYCFLAGPSFVSSEKASLWTCKWSLTNVITGLFCAQITRTQLRLTSSHRRACWFQAILKARQPRKELVGAAEHRLVIPTDRHLQSLLCVFSAYFRAYRKHTSERTCSSSVT